MDETSLRKYVLEVEQDIQLEEKAEDIIRAIHQHILSLHKDLRAGNEISVDTKLKQLMEKVQTIQSMHKTELQKLLKKKVLINSLIFGKVLTDLNEVLIDIQKYYVKLESIDLLLTSKSISHENILKNIDSIIAMINETYSTYVEDNHTTLKHLKVFDEELHKQIIMQPKR